MNATATTIHRDLTTLPFKDHPLFLLRKYTILAAILGILLCGFATGNPDPGSSPIFFNIFFLIDSILVCVADLIAYAREKAKNPETDPKWPLTKYIIFDFVLAALLFVTFWCCFVYLSWAWTYYNYGSPGRVLQCYGALAGLVCSILHAKAFWKQLMARKKHAWLTSLPATPCARCGYTEIEEPVTLPQHQQQHPAFGPSDTRPANVFPYAGPSANVRQTDVLTPEQSESAMEEGLLIGSDLEGGYQTMTEPTVEQPESVVVGKGKGKAKRAAKRSESSTADNQD